MTTIIISHVILQLLFSYSHTAGDSGDFNAKNKYADTGSSLFAKTKHRESNLKRFLDIYF
jgi:hypothetical protein